MHMQFFPVAHRARSTLAGENRLDSGHAVFSSVLFFPPMQWLPFVIVGNNQTCFSNCCSEFLRFCLLCPPRPQIHLQKSMSSPSTLPCHHPPRHSPIFHSCVVNFPSITLKPKPIFHLASDKSLQVFPLECAAINFFLVSATDFPLTSISVVMLSL